MRAELERWREGIRTGEKGRPTVIHCLPGCDVLGTHHARNCAFDYAVARVYELERALGL